MTEYKSLRGMASVVVLLLGVLLLVDVLSIGSGLLQLDLLGRIQSGEFSDGEAEANDSREAALGFLGVAMYLVTGIAFIAWFRRAYGNLDHFGHTRAHDTGWAIGAWIVPIISLFRPFQMAREIWHASTPDTLYTGDASATPTLLASWWGAWILGNLVGQVAFRTTLGATSVAEIEGSTMAQLASNLVTVVSAPLAILVVRELTRRQEARAIGLGDAEAVARVFE